MYCCREACEPTCRDGACSVVGHDPCGEPCCPFATCSPRRCGLHRTGSATRSLYPRMKMAKTNWYKTPCHIRSRSQFPEPPCCYGWPCKAHCYNWHCGFKSTTPRC